MAKTKSTQRRGERRAKPEQPIPFRGLMTKARNEVHERLQLFGDLPECGPKFCCELDWLHVLMTGVTDAAERTRLDESDPLVIKALKRQLAIIAAACEMWSDSLEEEGK